MSLILGALAGFATAIVTEVSKFFLHKEDKKHELEKLSLQLKVSQKIQDDCDSCKNNEPQFIYLPESSGIKWVDAVNGLVRPLITIILICLYTFIRVIYTPDNGDGVYWTEEDSTLLTAIVSYYFGQRAVGKKYV